MSAAARAIKTVTGDDPFLSPVQVCFCNVSAACTLSQPFSPVLCGLCPRAVSSQPCNPLWSRSGRSTVSLTPPSAPPDTTGRVGVLHPCRATPYLARRVVFLFWLSSPLSDKFALYHLVHKNAADYHAQATALLDCISCHRSSHSVASLTRMSVTKCRCALTDYAPSHSADRRLFARILTVPHGALSAVLPTLPGRPRSALAQLVRRISLCIRTASQVRQIHLIVTFKNARVFTG